MRTLFLLLTVVDNSIDLSHLMSQSIANPPHLSSAEVNVFQLFARKTLEFNFDWNFHEITQLRNIS